MNNDCKEIKKRKHPLIKDVKKMLKEHNLEYGTPQVVAKLTNVAENMALALLKDACYYSNKTDSDKANITKSDIELAIKMRNEEMADFPDEDAVIDAAVAVNGNPLYIRENYGIALPKETLGNVNYQLVNPEKKMKLEASRQQNRPCFTFLVPFKNYIPTKAGNMNMNNYMFKHPAQAQLMRNINDIPMKITITPKFGPMPSSSGISMLKKN